MTTVQFILGAELSGAVALNGCASTPISCGDEVYVRFRIAAPLRYDDIEPTDTQSPRVGSSLTRPWFQYKPWLSKMLFDSNPLVLDKHQEQSGPGKHANVLSFASHPGKDKPWLGQILYR